MKLVYRCRPKGKSCRQKVKIDRLGGPASAGISRDSYTAQGLDKGDTLAFVLPVPKFRTR
jgi:hypothetical protein